MWNRLLCDYCRPSGEASRGHGYYQTRVYKPLCVKLLAILAEPHRYTVADKPRFRNRNHAAAAASYSGVVRTGLLLTDCAISTGGLSRATCTTATAAT